METERLANLSSLHSSIHDAAVIFPPGILTMPAGQRHRVVLFFQHLTSLISNPKHKVCSNTKPDQKSANQLPGISNWYQGSSPAVKFSHCKSFSVGKKMGAHSVACTCSLGISLMNCEDKGKFYVSCLTKICFYFVTEQNKCCGLTVSPSRRTSGPSKDPICEGGSGGGGGKFKASIPQKMSVLVVYKGGFSRSINTEHCASE